MNSNQNNETGKPATDDIAVNEQNTLPADIPPPAPLENQFTPSEITPPQTQPPMEVLIMAMFTKRKNGKNISSISNCQGSCPHEPLNLPTSRCSTAGKIPNASLNL